jgi:hypothetical protein
MKFSCKPCLLTLGTVLATAFALTLSGCSMGDVSSVSGKTPITAGAITGGIVHGGPNPVTGSRVVIYATTSTGYGVGTALQEATQVGSSLHQDTSSNGSFSFAGGYTCPAGSYIYIVAYGGNSGAGNNPNAILMAALGSCNSLFSGSKYVGGNIWIDELTTVAAGYALSNFINVAGDAVNGYTVGIGADAANSAATGCVANTYYGSGCTTTTAAGLAHAFALASTLVSNTTGLVNSVSSNGAVIPYQLINTLGNVLQACINSTGGGTDATLGTPTTTTTSSGASHDGTSCGRLSAYTSYTSSGTASGTLNASGNTLGFIQNLAKRPGGTSAKFNTSCDSNSGTGSTTAASCIFNLSAPTSFYLPTMTATPPDWMLAIYYPKGSFSNTANSVVCGTATPTTNALLYPKVVVTDINDDIDIVNTDASTNICTNVLSIGFDGTPIGSSAFDNYGALVVSAANDSFGHTIVPVHGTNGATYPSSNGVRIYTTGTDSTISLQQTLVYNGVNTGPTDLEQLPYYVNVDGNDTIWIDGRSALKLAGYATLAAGNSHGSPVYTVNNVTGTSTSNGLPFAIDPNNTIITAPSSSSGTARPYAWVATSPATLATTPPTYAVSATTDEGTPASNTSNNGAAMVTDTSGNIWEVFTEAGAGAAGAPILDEVIKVSYSVSAGVVSFGTTATTYVATGQADYSIAGGVMDGNNVIWWSDLQGSNVTGPPVIIYSSYLHGFDTVNAAYLPTSVGCAFTQSNGIAIAGWNIGASSTTFTTTLAPPSVGANISLSGFATSTFFNGQTVTVASSTTTAPFTFTVNNVFGQAASSSTTETGLVSNLTATTCGSNSTDINYPSSGSYPLYGVRGVAIDASGNIWTANGVQGHITEIIGIAAPTWPNFIHNGTSNKP